MIRIYTFEKNFLVLFYVWGSTTSMLQSHCKEIVYFLPLTFWPLVLNTRPLNWESSALIAAHLPPGFESAFFKKGYLLILTSGGVTRDVQVKHIYHKDSKTAYRERNETDAGFSHWKFDQGEIWWCGYALGRNLLQSWLCIYIKESYDDSCLWWDQG